jgi:hypothetical protein
LPEVHTTTGRRVRGIVTHRLRRTERTDAIRWRQIPVTTVPRTVVDLAAVLAEDDLARAFHEAAVKHRTSRDQVEAILSRRHNWPGGSKLRRVIWGDAPFTLSHLESLFLRRLRAVRLPQPEMNRRVDGRYVDCRWREARLTVELDSYHYHRTRHAWEQDREREARARGDVSPLHLAGRRGET